MIRAVFFLYLFSLSILFISFLPGLFSILLCDPMRSNRPQRFPVAYRKLWRQHKVSFDILFRGDCASERIVRRVGSLLYLSATVHYRSISSIDHLLWPPAHEPWNFPFSHYFHGRDTGWPHELEKREKREMIWLLWIEQKKQGEGRGRNRYTWS